VAVEVVDPPVEAAAAAPVPDAQDRAEALALLASIFLVAACGLIYELLIATVSSYQLGSSVTQFSVSVGLFVGSMGLGSWLSQRVTKHLLAVFIALELVLGVVGGLSAAVLFWSYTAGPLYWVALYGCLVLIGALVGVELPILVRLLDRYGQLRTVVAQALSADYLGCLVGSLAFPLLLLPALGQMRTAFLVGLVNVGVAVYTLQTFRHRLRIRLPLVACGLTAAVLAAGFVFSIRIHGLLERGLYDDEVIYTRQTPFQRIVFTRWREDLRLFLDGNLQFSSVDEHRYHEALVHPAMGLAASRGEVLLLGGGDGLGVREVLRHPEVKRVTLVDLDPDMTRLGRTFPALAAQNGRSLEDPRVRVVNEDAHRFLERTADRYDVIIADLPDPNGDALAKLYSVEFYRLARQHLAEGGVFVTQATSPFFSRSSFWCVAKSMREAGLQVKPLHANVPSFGEWGFVLARRGEQGRVPASAARDDLKLDRIALPPGLRFLTPQVLRTLEVFDPDMSEVPTEISTADHPRILRYYLGGSRKWE